MGGIGDKAQEAAGKVKEGAGDVLNKPALEYEGQTEQDEAEAQQAEDRLREASEEDPLR
jgi:uncharacterized protein YjbJ (UPF0337 family)